MQQRYFEPDLVDEINDLRRNPQQYAQKLKKYFNYFDGKILKVPGREKHINTEEGVKAYQEAYDFLQKLSPLKPYTPCKGLCRVGIDFLKDIADLTPEASRNADSEKLVDKYGDYSGGMSRATDFGGEIPEYVVMSLLVSDGDPNREKRKALIHDEYTRIGVAFGKHNSSKQSTVIFTSENFTNNVDKDDNGLIEFTPYLKEKPAPPPQPKPTPPPQPKPTSPPPQPKPTPPPQPKPTPPPEPKKPPEVVEESFKYRIVTENGKKKKYTIVTKKYSDRTTKVESFEEDLNE